jgi:molecular chaperone DnaK
MNNFDNSVIRIGIDLGTTNSEVVVNVDEKNEILKNTQGGQFTPSIFGFDKAGNEIVGKIAQTKLATAVTEEDVNNVKQEIKRLMGTSDRIVFSRGNVSLTPEEISSKILISLKSDVIRKFPEFPTKSAVITVPAYFDTLQNEATKRAGNLAGFDQVVLLQEPIAAAMSYGFKSDVNENWLVYDLGGGTFDVALISANEGMLKVVEHGGDNFLGGKNIDDELVEKVLRAKILETFSLENFEKSNEKFDVIFSKLKSIAETTKIELSNMDSVNIEIDNIGNDDEGKEIYMSFEYTKSEFQELIKPIVDKTINIALKVIADSHLDKSNINKVIFVGGPTQIPYIRAQVEKQLQIPIDTSSDPLTAVAEGAAIYGLSQKVESDIANSTHTPISKNEIKVEVNYESMTTEEDQMITGILDIENEMEYSVKINSANGFYSSPNIKTKNGKFFATVAIEKNKSNTYNIEVINEQGDIVPSFPNSFTITHGMSVQNAPIPHNVGIVYAKKTYGKDVDFLDACDVFFERGSIVPLTKTNTYKTITKLIKGSQNPLPMPVYEGDSKNPKYNQIITKISIDGNDLPYDLPEGTDIDITISINESREISVDAYIPKIDEYINARVDEYAQEISDERINHDFYLQKNRFMKTKSSLPSNEQAIFEKEFDSIESSLGNLKDLDVKQKSDRDIKKLTEKLDSYDKSNEFTMLSLEYSMVLSEVKSDISLMDDIDSKNRLESQLLQIENDGKKATDGKDELLLGRVLTQINDLRNQILLSSPDAWVQILYLFKTGDAAQASDPAAVRDYIAQADIALENNDFEELKSNVKAIVKLLPLEQQQKLSGGSAGITK